ncbi:hypothetical protein B6I54_04595 [Klebsiella pneumoniae]|nr:hypothetical protein B6I54_04595 [Klebsiella pneumoniae]
MTSNQLAENSVIQLLNSVKLARDNAERADNRVDHSFYYALTIALEELQERRKADSEQVALQPELAKVIYHFRDWNEGFPVERFKADYVISWMLVNYPPAQPAPAVPTFDEWLELSGNKPLGWVKDAMRESYDACRAAMLQGSNYPVVPDGYVMVPINMTTEQMRAVQRDSTLGTFASAHLKGAFDLYREFWSVAVAASPQEVRKSNVVDTYQGADGKEHEIIYLTSSQKEVK